ncbi:hypothetical protein DDZ13_08710 [Coraliomargarita sinensis]|uniref:Response regulatory domain-containing protein n=1 Tax=Coraliomargarita sinensis TaxID=2174842 RepID=A0A317ZJY3_9BACT|nr:response regulator [Coraliomargarita sinensis]PXA04109.1 hypothetical protein DDZ13_08710 [Coraliomargarita sinensis]
MVSSGSKPAVLVVDDSETDREIISIVCDALGCHVDLASDGLEALKLYNGKSYDLVLADYVMEPMNGIYVVSRIKEANPDAVCLIVTGFPNEDVRRFAHEGGVFDLITKPIQAQELKETLRLALNASQGATEKVSGIALSNRMDNCALLVGEGTEIRKIREQIAQSISSQKPLLIAGPGSTVKGEIARFIHRNGPQAGKRMVEVSCVAMEESALRYDLIAEGGAWCSLLRQAEGGTLVLDQILSLPLDVQKDLAAQFESISSKMQVLVLSDDLLEDALEEGRIDDEFYFKVTMDQIHLPPGIPLSN